MRIVRALCLGLVAVPLCARAQGTTYDTVRVVDAAGHPIPFASISVRGGSARVTNADGVMLLHLGADTVNVLVRRMGFEAFQGKIGRDANRGAFHVTLGNAAQALKKVVVKERAGNSPLERNGFYDRMLEVQNGAPTGEFFTPADVEARASAKISQFLYASRFAKIRQFTGNSAVRYLGRPRAYIEGRTGCAMSVLIDGIVAHNMLGDVKEGNSNPNEPGTGLWGSERTSIDDLVNGQEVMAIEVYPSIATAPMSIASKVLGSACGIVAIWTGGRG